MNVSLCTEWSIERQVLHSQCKRLEAQNYNLTRTAEQLSLTMGVSTTEHICMSGSLFLADLCTLIFSYPHPPPHPTPFSVFVMLIVSVLHLSGAGESEAESERGERETAGPARALQEVFDTP